MNLVNQGWSRTKEPRREPGSGGQKRAQCDGARKYRYIVSCGARRWNL